MELHLQISKMKDREDINLQHVTQMIVYSNEELLESVPQSTPQCAEGSRAPTTAAPVVALK
jgi:hypothetical protein